MRNAAIEHKDLIVWQKSMDLVIALIDLTECLNTPGKHYRLIDQLEASATSIPMNIAEGKGRQTAKEFRQYLFIARGSLFETLTLLDVFRLRDWIPVEKYNQLEKQAEEIGRMLNGLIASIRSAT